MSSWAVLGPDMGNDGYELEIDCMHLWSFNVCQMYTNQNSIFHIVFTLHEVHIDPEHDQFIVETRLKKNR